MTIQDKPMLKKVQLRPMTSDATRTLCKQKRSVPRKACINYSSYSLNGMKFYYFRILILVIKFLDKAFYIIRIEINLKPQSRQKRYSSTVAFKKQKLRKSESSEKSYGRLRKRILAECKVTEEQLRNINKRCKTFFWSPDMSFCAFATQNQFKKATAALRRSSQVKLGRKREHSLAKTSLKV